ncbi:MAG: FecCD family ABC transporter permease [Ilumatobacteraceae bacterium]|jgi:iron complex transport system permease protein
MTTPTAFSEERAGRAVWWLLGGFAVVIVAVVGLMLGPAGPAWWRVPIALLDRLPFITIDSGVSDAQWNIVWQIRAPRVVLAALVGAMLSLAGASYQGVFRNPLVDPYLLGVAAGAGLGATLAFSVARDTTSTWPVDPVPLAAFVGGVVAVALTYTVGTAFGRSRSATTLVLAGVAVTSLATAIQTFVLQRNNDVVRQVYSWILGRLTSATWGDVRLVLPYILTSSIILLMYRRVIDVLRVGDDEARALGVNVNQVRVVVVLAATLGTSAAVAVSGLIGFVGIIVPHAVRLLMGSSNRIVLPLSMFAGAVFLIGADIPGRLLTSPSETPIGVVTAFFGAPFFLFLLRTREVRQ